MQDDHYFPLPDGAPWEVVSPEAAGFDPTRLEPAVAAVRRSETSWPTDIRAHLEAGFFEPPPFNELLGPTQPRGRPNGLLLRGGRLVARWGDTRRVDMTFSVAKSYLSLIAGIAVTDGLIRDLDEPVGSTVQGWRLRRRSQRADHLATFPPADVGMGGDALGQVRSDRPQSRRFPRSGVGTQGRCPASAQARDVLGIQRCPRQPAESGTASPIRTAASRGVRGAHHAADRQLGRMALGRVSQFLRRDRRTPAPVGSGRRPLGRRHFHPRRGPGPTWAPDVEKGAVGRRGHSAGIVDCRLAHPVPAQPPLRLHVVAQYGPRTPTRARRRTASSHSAAAAISPGSTPPTTLSRSCAGRMWSRQTNSWPALRVRCRPDAAGYNRLNPPSMTNAAPVT